MNFDEFTGQVQHRLELADTGQAVRAARATLSTLGRRVQAGDAEDLASALPMEIGRFLTAVDEHGERFDWSEFVDRVAEVEDVDGSTAAYHAQVIVDLVAEAATDADVRQLRDQLPEGEEGWDELFEIVDAGGWSETRGAEAGD